MKTWKIATILGLATLVLALFASSAFAYMGGYGGYGNGGFGGGMMGRGGMMGGYGGYGNGYYTSPQAPAQQGTSPYQTIYPFQFGGGCHGFGRGGYGFSNNYITPYTNTGATINITTAATISSNYVASIGNADLVVAEVEEYTGNFYVQVVEKSTGNGAFELIVNKYTGVVYPEMGPNMMWNTKYGMMRGGILGGIFGTPTTATTVTASQAVANAQQFLTAYYPNTTTGEATAFYGYYTIEVLSNGTPFGMISVNGYTGQVWYHNWHGTYIQELEVG